jgi:hypothetical protein
MYNILYTIGFKKLAHNVYYAQLDILSTTPLWHTAHNRNNLPIKAYVPTPGHVRLSLSPLILAR